jgi:cell shape-determining protein MreC
MILTNFFLTVFLLHFILVLLTLSFVAAFESFFRVSERTWGLATA